MDVDQAKDQSLRISGQIGKEKVFYEVGGDQRVRGYAVPSDPKTPQQRARRSFFRNGMEWWANESQAFRDNYNQLVKDRSLALHGVNLFLIDWYKGVYVAEVIKSIQRGSVFCVAGLNNITIVAVDLDKSVLHYNPHAMSIDGPPIVLAGITGAILSSSTNIAVSCLDTAGTGLVPFAYEVVEFF